MAGLALKQKLQEKGLLDQFSEDAITWAQQGVEWIEIEGESFTLISQLEKLKGVEPSDFQRQSGLSEASYEKSRILSEAHQRLLDIPGVRRGSIPTTFAVDGALVLHCGGPDAKAGITGIVRQQRPEWVRAQYLLANMPATLAYLSHGSSKVAKATRDLTIGTTMNVAKAAAEQENAPIAVHQLAGSPQVNALLLQLMEVMGAEARTAQTTADTAQVTAERAEAKADKALQQISAKPALKPKTAKPSQATKELLLDVWRNHYDGVCPCCEEPVSEKNLEIDHWLSRDNAEPNALWPVCRNCNNRVLGRPVANGGDRTPMQQKQFDAFQAPLRRRLKVTQGLQLGLELS